MTDEIKRITDTLINTLNPLEIRLFGSFANNTFSDQSDFDFYIIVDDKAGDIVELVAKAYASLRGIRTRPVDIIINYQKNYNKRKLLPTIEKTVAEEGRLLYAS